MSKECECGSQDEEFSQINYIEVHRKKCENEGGGREASVKDSKGGGGP